MLYGIPIKTTNISTARNATDPAPTVLDYQQVAQRPLVYFPASNRVVEDSMPTTQVLQKPARRAQ